MRLAFTATDVVAESVRALAQAVATPGVLVASTTTLAAPPPAVELLKAARTRRALERSQAAAGCTGVGVVEGLCLVDIAAGLPRTRCHLDCCLSAKGVLDVHFDVLVAGRNVVQVEIVVSAHLFLNLADWLLRPTGYGTSAAVRICLPRSYNLLIFVWDSCRKISLFVVLSRLGFPPCALTPVEDASDTAVCLAEQLRLRRERTETIKTLGVSELSGGLKPLDLSLSFCWKRSKSLGD